MIGLGLAGILLLPTRYTRIGRRLLVASILFIAANGILPLGDVLTIPLGTDSRNGTLRRDLRVVLWSSVERLTRRYQLGADKWA
jgi:hypothetical protein